MTERYLERVILGEEWGAVSWLIRVALWPLSLIYCAGLALYLGIYSVGLRRRCRLPVPVISVGNLTFGGTGKTPAVQAICRMLVEQGRKVCVLSRGHGGSARGSVVVSDGVSVLTDSDECGDEPVLLAQTLPGVPVIVGKDRRESGRLACRRFAPDVIVLDDGLQYWQLHRDLDIVVMDGGRPFGSGFAMPMGDLREPVSGLRRANVVLLSGETDQHERVSKRVSGLAPRALVLRCARRPVSLRKADCGDDLGLDWINGRRVLAFCGIGRPESFRETLESMGTLVERIIAFPDHHRYDANDLQLIQAESKSLGVEAVVTTEKDSARLGPGAPIDDLYVLGIELKIEGVDQLAEYVSNTIDREDKTPAAEETAH